MDLMTEAIGSTQRTDTTANRAPGGLDSLFMRDSQHKALNGLPKERGMYGMTPIHGLG
jgi:hypothetical protein